MQTIPEQLRQVTDLLCSLQPEMQSIPYRRHHWETNFKNDTDFIYLANQYRASISRGNLAELAKTTLKSGSISWFRRLFLATMLWGYGDVGYGPYRTAKMLALQDSSIKLQQACSLISTGKLLEAYREFLLPMCGPAFFTKYFYFIGLGCGTKPQPLILDSVVARNLEEQLGLDIRIFATVARDKQGKICAVGSNPLGYIIYVQTLNDWAAELGCRADSIELYLFNLE